MEDDEREETYSHGKEKKMQLQHGLLGNYLSVGEANVLLCSKGGFTTFYGYLPTKTKARLKTPTQIR